jgi:hypothetical protein
MGVGWRQGDGMEGEIRTDGRLANGMNAIWWRCKEMD